jgi:hypothetical protein
LRGKESNMKTFGTYEQVADMRPCMKRPIVIHCLEMEEEFRVNALEGDYKQGKPGDYLMRGVTGELYICDGEIFRRTYDFVSEPKTRDDLEYDARQDRTTLVSLLNGAGEAG